MILAVDVQYRSNIAFVAGVLFDDWVSETPISEHISTLHDIEEYAPGSFYKRELPCILKLLDEHRLSPTCIIVDGYVYLDGRHKPGLGRKLFDSRADIAEVVGIAKKYFAGIGLEHKILRGKSEKPLYVTTTGNLDMAKKKVLSMFGSHRIPALIKRADQICRAEAKKSDASGDADITSD